jgi:hypothetical protein
MISKKKRHTYKLASKFSRGENTIQITAITTKYHYDHHHDSPEHDGQTPSAKNPPQNLQNRNKSDPKSSTQSSKLQPQNRST